MSCNIWFATDEKTIEKLVSTNKIPTFASRKKKGIFLPETIRHRDVAQLVAHYVRDVGVACSSHVIPTKGDNERIHLSPFLFHARLC